MAGAKPKVYISSAFGSKNVPWAEHYWNLEIWPEVGWPPSATKVSK